MEKLLARCNIRTALCSVLLIVLVPLAGSNRLSTPSSAPDLLLLNAHVVTMDQTRPAAQAIAIGVTVSHGRELVKKRRDSSLEVLAPSICTAQLSCRELLMRTLI